MNQVSFLELGDVAVENIEEIYFVMSFISLSNATTVYPSFSIKSRTCTSSLSLSGIRSCSRRMEPGTSRFLMCLIIFFRSGLLSVQCADVPTNGDVSQPAHCFSQGRIGHSERRPEPSDRLAGHFFQFLLAGN